MQQDILNMLIFVASNLDWCFGLNHWLLSLDYTILRHWAQWRMELLSRPFPHLPRTLGHMYRPALRPVYTFDGITHWRFHMPAVDVPFIIIIDVNVMRHMTLHNGTRVQLCGIFMVNIMWHGQKCKLAFRYQQNSEHIYCQSFLE